MEIKFRAWDGEEMFYPAQITFTEAIWSVEPGRGVSIPYQSHIELMQFTGKLDKNGKEIYKGDILYTEFEKSRFLNIYDIYLKQWKHVVDWDDKKLGWNIPEIESVFRESLVTGVHNKDKPTPEWEIIGNIYQNPELL